MEATNDQDLNVKPPPLSSDQLNYLIWRYVVILNLYSPTCIVTCADIVQIPSRVRYDLQANHNTRIV
jgi:hypothetical protein